MTSAFFIWRHLSLFLTGRGKNAPPPAGILTRTQNWRRPKACAIMTFSLIQFRMFFAILVSWRCIDEEIWMFCRAEVGVSYIFPKYSKNYKNDHYICLNHGNDFIFAWVRDIDKKNIFCKFGVNTTWWRHFPVFPYIGKWRLISSNDFIMSDLHQACRKCFSYRFLASMQIYYLRRCYDHFCNFCYNMEIYRKHLPLPDKKSISPHLYISRTLKSLRMCETKLS